MTTDKTRRVRVEPGIYRRGDVYEIRVSGRDSTGRRRESWRTVGTSIRQAQKALRQARAEADRVPMPVATVSRSLTVRAFLEDHYLPYVDDECVAKAGSLHKNTAVTYRRYA